VTVPSRDGTSWTTAEATVTGRVEEVRVAARTLTTPRGVASSTVVAVGAPLGTIDDGLAAFRSVLLALTALLAVAAGATAGALTWRRRCDR
jgi:hypothetical protein